MITAHEASLLSKQHQSKIPKWVEREVRWATKYGRDNIEFHSNQLDNHQKEQLEALGYQFGPSYAGRQRMFWK